MDVIQEASWLPGLITRRAAANEAKEKAKKAVADWQKIPFYHKEESKAAYQIVLRAEADYEKAQAAVYKGD
jgi:L-fucose mutarotase/ribose pyranase (RbsD/FucU family)